MISKITGELTLDKIFGEWWECSPIEIPYFDNLKLKIVYRELLDENYFENAELVISNFLKLSKSDKIKDSVKVLKNYEEIKGLEFVPKLKILNLEDIWDFVSPSEIHIVENEKEDIFIMISCECEWEEEHGLQLVFKDGKSLTRVSYVDGSCED